MSRYQVMTYDNELHRFTPQNGLRRGPWSKWGLRRAMRRLRQMGYDGNRTLCCNCHPVAEALLAELRESIGRLRFSEIQQLVDWCEENHPLPAGEPELKPVKAKSKWQQKFEALPEDEQLAEIQRMIERERRRQGIVVPSPAEASNGR